MKLNEYLIKWLNWFIEENNENKIILLYKKLISKEFLIENNFSQEFIYISVILNCNQILNGIIKLKNLLETNLDYEILYSLFILYRISYKDFSNLLSFDWWNFLNLEYEKKKNKLQKLTFIEIKNKIEKNNENLPNLITLKINSIQNQEKNLIK